MASAYAAAAGLRLRELDDGALAFQPVSWEVHILNPAAAAILLSCQESPRDLDWIAGFIGELTGETDHAKLRRQCVDLLDELGRLGLVQRA
ncbi:MAG: HPr-rel-A system PqqD family peptide chaperone [Burkholderiaceae bacterium]|jgi:PqqD family protein of HPr-rel-A system|nr:HPr-rel-A system PqqD family peptide chaperone [Burkholderiaceae bacterium]